MRRDFVNVLRPTGFHAMSYTEWGDPANPEVVICVHGLTRNGRDFDPLAESLSPRYRVLCPDVLGRGASDRLPDPSGYAYPFYLSDMAALIARAGVGDVKWVGTSMGGLIGMMLAAQKGTPVARLVVNDVGPFIPSAALRRIASYVGVKQSFASLAELESHLRRVHAPFGPLTDSEWSHLAAHSHWSGPDGWLTLAYDPQIAVPFADPATIADVDLWPVWDMISCPVLAVRGMESDLLTAETFADMQRRGPRAEGLELAGIGHAPALMAPDQIAAIAAFLAKE